MPLACRAAAEVFPWHEKSVRSYGAAPVRTTIPGSNSLKIVYNVSNGSAWLGFNLTGRDLSNTSGIGFWLKGDASNNVLNWQFANSSGNTYNASGSFNIRFNITFNEWRYVYLDWHYFELLNVTADDLWNRATSRSTPIPEAAAPDQQRHHVPRRLATREHLPRHLLQPILPHEQRVPKQ